MAAIERVVVYVTQAEKNRIAEEAERHGLSASRFLRMTILAHVAEDKAARGEK